MSTDERHSIEFLVEHFRSPLASLPAVLAHTFDGLIELTKPLNGQPLAWDDLKADFKRLMGISLEHQLRHSMPFEDATIRGLDLAYQGVEFDLKVRSTGSQSLGFSEVQNTNVALVLLYDPWERTFAARVGYPDQASNYNNDGKYYVTVPKRTEFALIFEGSF